ncbi:MAG: prolyl oligopeptidase family serine peptidase [Bacteroidales bacterium]|nr:prolyl oligopeptidase family serine peptidase [Bacteroidales bacterium]
MPYRLFVPETVDTARLPLVVFLHGSGERGSDNVRHLVNGVMNFVSPAVQAEFPSIVLVPQCPEGKRWVEADWKVRYFTRPERISPSLEQVIELIQYIIEKELVDTQRIYITGLSMGGIGTWDLIARFPSMFAAAVPVCGGGDTTTANLLKDMPIWAFHGAKDDVILPQLSRSMVTALQRIGASPGYTEYPDLGHGIWDRVYTDRTMFRWLFDQQLKRHEN